ncbi:unnamed protein product [Somion occarium]|uniref:Pali-domain-containing protein n=1 Tax=Somion occarium TaxID=3059160 RepID=A0ABP1DAM3_9APHY
MKITSWIPSYVSINLVTPVLLLCSFILLLLTCLSAPIIPIVDFFRLTTVPTRGQRSPQATMYYGLAGYCLISKLPFRGAHSDTVCVDTGIGYSLTAPTQLPMGPSFAVNAMKRSLSTSLVLNPVACGVTFVAFVVSLFGFRTKSYKPSRFVQTAVLTTTILAALLTTTAFVVDAMVASHVQNRINSNTAQLSVDWGSAVWITLSALFVTWSATITSSADMVGCWGRNRRVNKY